MKKIFVGLSLFALLLAGCNNSGGGSNPPIEKDSFTVTWKNFDGATLEVDENVPSGAIPSYDGSTPVKEKTENYEFAFSKWSPDIQPVTQDTVYTALFDSTLTAAYVSFDLNGGTTSSNSQSRYMASIEAENFFFDVKKENYNFRGWEYNSKKIFDELGNKINNVEIAESMTFKALFAQTATIYTITFVTNGGDPISPLSGAYGDPVDIPAPTKENSFFVGWFTDELFINKAYINTIPDENITLYAKWTEMYTVFEIDSKEYMHFGTYPQSVVADTNVINELSKITTTNSRGYYAYNGCEYAKQQVNVYANRSSYTYSNGSLVVDDSTQYFKVEPILWRVLKSDVSGNYTLLADQAINAHRYGYGNLNNYAESDIRSWINNEFFNSAFKSAEKGAILTTNVDNSPSTTNSNNNPYACENTDDKVFLLSYKDYKNPDYGFSSSYNSDSARYCEPTDYAIANFCEMDNRGGFNDRNCNYWTRSPDSDHSYDAWCVNFNGYFHYNNVYYGGSGVRPALNINL